MPMRDRIYLDHNATTPVAPEVLEAMLPYLSQHYGNASSIHSLGREAREAVEAVREQVAELLRASSPREIVFTSGGTESDNHAIRGVAEYYGEHKGRHIISARTEHHAVYHTCQRLEERRFEVTYLPVSRYGRVDVDALRDIIRDDTILITLMHANNETGTINPVEEIGAIAQEHGVLFHSDAVQTVGKLPVALDAVPIDLLSLSAHKFHGPKGVGALYIRRGTRMHRLMLGDSHERNRRAGTQNVPGIAGLGTAASLALRHIESESDRLRALTQRLEQGLCQRLDGVHINTDPEHRLPGTLNVSFEGVEAEALIIGLDSAGICVSSGSACASGSQEPSHVLRELGLPPQLAQGTVRFSLGRQNDEAQIDLTLDATERLAERIRRERMVR